MPLHPQESIKLHPSDDGPPVKSHEFIVSPNASIELGIIYSDFPESLPNVIIVGSRSSFDTLQQAALEELGGGRQIYSRDGEFSSHPMREFRFEVANKKIVYESRIIAAGHRMYRLIVVSSAEVDVSRDVETFFTSFHLLNSDKTR